MNGVCISVCILFISLSPVSCAHDLSLLCPAYIWPPYTGRADFARGLGVMRRGAGLVGGGLGDALTRFLYLTFAKFCRSTSKRRSLKTAGPLRGTAVVAKRGFSCRRPNDFGGGMIRRPAARCRGDAGGWSGTSIEPVAALSCRRPSSARIV